MNELDIAILFVIGFSALISILRGFFKELLSLLSWAIAFFIASHFYSDITEYLVYFNNQTIRNIMAIVILFVSTLLVSSIVAHVISELAKRSGLSAADRILGVCFGILRGILIVTALLFSCNSFTSLAESLVWKNSILIPHFEYLIHQFFAIYKNSVAFFIP